MNNVINRVVKWMLMLVVSAVSFGSCSKDENPAWLTLDSSTLFLSELGQTVTLRFSAGDIKNISILKIPAGWEVTSDLATQLITVKAPAVLGGDAKAVRSGTVSIVGYTYEGRSISKFLLVAVSSKRDISNMQANSFIVSEPFTVYSFDATRKGETQETMLPADVKIIWQTVDGLIEATEYKEGRFSFYIDGKENVLASKGNALVGAYDGAGALIWTWHLWIVDAADLQEQLYANGKTFMSLNLGALGCANKTKAEVLASYGLFYQWGRKTPFVGPYTYDAASAEDAGMYNESGKLIMLSYGVSTADTGTLSYADAHPMSFLLGAEASGDWLSTPSDALWSDEKTANDPCPKGWRVPSKSDFEGLGIIDKAAGKEQSYGWDMTDGKMTAYYPGAGFRPYLTGRIQNIYNPISGVEVPKPWIGYYWTTGTDGAKSSAMYFWFDAADASKSGVQSATAQYRANAMQIRCVKE